MSDVTKNEIIIQALKSAGYQEIRLKIVPIIFIFGKPPCHTELEFSKGYLEDIPLVTLQGLMRDTMLPAIKHQLGKKVYVNENGISIIPRTYGHEKNG